MKSQSKYYRPCRDLKVGDRIDQGGRDAEILQVELQNLVVACLLRFEDNNEASWRYYSFMWQQDTMVQRYEEKP